jgi:DNA polymerase II small subunit/DNA polymerase delta subunit B
MTASLGSFSAVYVVSDFGLGLHRIEGLAMWKVIMKSSFQDQTEKGKSAIVNMLCNKITVFLGKSIAVTS